MDQSTSVGESSALMLDGRSRPHISYFDGTNKAIKHAWRDDAGVWHAEVVDGAGEVEVGPNSSILWASGTVHISYFDQANEVLKVAHQVPGQEWMTEIVDSEMGTGEFSSIGVDSMGRIHLTYPAKPQKAIRHAWRALGQDWKIETVSTLRPFDSDTGSALAIDASDGLHVCYQSNGNLMLGHRPPGGSWTTFAGDDWLTGYECALRLSPAGELHVTYQRKDPPELYYGHAPSPGSFTPTKLADLEVMGTSTDIGIGPDGSIHVCADDSYFKTIRYAWRPTHGSWVVTELEGDWQRDCSLAVDARGGVHLSYWKLEEKELHYAYRCPNEADRAGCGKLSSCAHRPAP